MAALLEPLKPDLERQREACGPSVLAIQTFFSASEDGEFQKSTRTGAGVYVHRNRRLIVTSAHVVGLVSSVGGSHKCRLGRTFALTMRNKLLRTKILAVNFAGDVAVLQAEAESASASDLPPSIGVSDSAPSVKVLLPPFTVITRHERCNGDGVMQVKPSPRVEDLRRRDWPYDVEDGLGWVKYGGEPVAVNVVPGSPWFNFAWKVIGIASWPMGREPAGSVGGFVVHPMRIRSLVEYAKRKDPADPVVIDAWITAPPTFADAEPQPQEVFQNVPEGFVSTIRLPFNFPACVPPGFFG